ncbi:Ig-like domain-containing protein [Curtobacterium sp. RHCKG23]|uniref:Ig-like domain-containing protein n=1 Tax=Curtobacterium citri TaxID=3055139 RepID=A0ABT7T579_9MICO|nr:Ig-like domain-containing protein [Curtobacterium citri]MDM7884099.1 Ig-like domain-containing protein [Curtobacterium citri]
MLMFSSWSRHRSVVRLAAAGLLVTLLGSTGVLAAGDGAAAVGSSEQRSTDVVDVTADPARVGPGAVSDWIRLVPSSLVLGELRVTAPPGTTIVWADADVRPLEGSIASDGSSATWVGRNSWSEGWRVPKVRLRVSPETPPGRTSGSVRVVDPEGGAVVATGTLPVDVTAPDVAIPVERTPLGVGTESGWIAVVPERTVAGVLTVTAPPGTSITAADADVRPLAGRIAEDDSFATVAGRLADRDLRPFFEQWGIPIGEQAAADLAQRPALQRAIWENVDTSTDRPEHVLPEVGTPVGAIVGAPEVVVGQRHFPDVPVEGIGSSDGAPVSVGATTVSAVDQGYGSITVELVDPRGPREVIDGTIRARAGNLVDLLGQKDRPVARLAILPEDHELRLVPRTTYQAHSSWAGREYIGIELRSADGERSLGDWSIKGDETAYPLADRFDAHWQEGQILVIRHQQHDGVFPWRDSERMPASTDLVQRFRIVDGGLVRDDGVFTAVSIASPEDGADTDLRPVLTGHGEPGSAVVVRRKDTDDVLGEGHVDHRGEWTIELDSDLEERRQTLVVTQYGPGDDPGTV